MAEGMEADWVSRLLEPKPVPPRKPRAAKMLALTSAQKKQSCTEKGIIPGAKLEDGEGHKRVALSVGPNHKPYSEKDDLAEGFYVVTVFTGKKGTMTTRVKYENIIGMKVTGNVSSEELAALRARYLK